MTITASTFYNNYANNNSTSGGAICNGGTLTITGTTFSTNSSQGNNGGYGGAIYHLCGDPLRYEQYLQPEQRHDERRSHLQPRGDRPDQQFDFWHQPREYRRRRGPQQRRKLVSYPKQYCREQRERRELCRHDHVRRLQPEQRQYMQFQQSRGSQWDRIPSSARCTSNGGPTETMALQKGSPALDAGNPAGCRDFSGTF